LLELFLENHRRFLKKATPKTFLLAFAGRSFLSGTSFHAVFPFGFQASLSRGIQHKTHSPAGECDRPENSFCINLLFSKNG
jgi:hypothetical protein